MRNWWIRLGCFLTGYNFHIVMQSSEVAVKSVKRYTAAIIIVCILWAFIGYSFTDRYLHGGLWGSLAGGLIFVIIIIQIERQIILSVAPGIGLYLSRGVIAMIMSTVGAIIIDQIIFKDDIELEKITSIQQRVNEVLPAKTEQFNLSLKQLDTVIQAKERERLNYIADVGKHPFTKTYSTRSVPIIETKPVIDSSGTIINSQQVRIKMLVDGSEVPNPKQQLIPGLERDIAMLRAQRAEKETNLLNIRPQLEKEIGEKTGFLDELKIMFRLITDSTVALIVYLLWFLLLLGLEMLVLISKKSDKKNDYEETIMHQMDLQKKKLALLYKIVEK